MGLKERMQMEPGTEHRFTLHLGPHPMHFVRRPITTPAKEGMIGFLDGVSDKGNPVREVGVFKNGEWRGGTGGRKLRIQPLTWTVAAEMDAASG